MKKLTKNEVQLIAGGFLPLLAALVAVVAAPIVINNHRKEYNKWGRDLSQTLYDHNHPYDPNK